MEPKKTKPKNPVKPEEWLAAAIMPKTTEQIASIDAMSVCFLYRFAVFSMTTGFASRNSPQNLHLRASDWIVSAQNGHFLLGMRKW